jgi:hypothetical protein
MLALLIENDRHHGYSRVINLGHYHSVNTELIIEDARAEIEKKGDMHFDVDHSIVCIDKAGKMYELKWEEGQTETAHLCYAGKEVIVMGE